MNNPAFVMLCAATAVRGAAFWLCWLGMLSLASFQLGASPGQIALITAATSIPHIFLSPFLGTLVDRIHPRTAMLGAFIWNIGIALALLQAGTMWHIYIIAFAWSTSGAVLWPAIGSLLKQMIPEEHLVRANGILHSMWEGTLIAGPLLTGLLIDKVGPRAPMAVGAAISALSVLLLLPIRVTVTRADASAKSLNDLLHGLRLMTGLPDLRAIALWGAGAWAGFNVLIAVEPVFVRDILGGSGSMLTWMYSVGGIGSTAGALALGWFAFARYELRTAASGLAMAGSMFALYIAIARWPHVLPIQAFIGMGFAIYQTASQSLVQRRAPAEVVGRTLAAKRQVEEVAGLAGSLAAGAIASSLGTRQTMIGAGVLMTIAAIALLGRSFRLPGPPATKEIVHDLEEMAIGIDPAHDRVV